MIYKNIEDFIEKFREEYDVEYLKKQFKNVYFIIGTAYAGKSTMIKMLSEYYDGIIIEIFRYNNVHNIVILRTS